MKNNNQSIIVSYYLVLGMIVMISLVNTIYQGSLRVTFGKKVAVLEQQQQILLLQEKQLEEKISTKLSLATVESSLNQDLYQPIKPNFIIKTPSTVALK